MIQENNNNNSLFRVQGTSVVPCLSFWYIYILGISETTHDILLLILITLFRNAIDYRASRTLLGIWTQVETTLAL